jgi:hypothetical protein
MGGSAAVKVHTVLDYQEGHQALLASVFQDLTQGGVAWVARIPARVGVWHSDHVVPLAT